MLLEGIQNIDIFTAIETQPYALKKYIAKRLNIDRKQTFIPKSNSSSFSTSKNKNIDFYKGVKFYTNIKIQERGTLKIEVRAVGNRIGITYISDMRKVIYKVICQDANDLVDKILKNIKEAKIKLSNNETFSLKNITIEAQDLIDSFNGNATIEFEYQKIYSRNESFRMFILKIPMNKTHKKNNISFLFNMMKEPTIKRLMDKEDKINKDEQIVYAKQSNYNIIAAKDKIIDITLSFYDHIKDSNFIIDGIEIKKSFNDININLYVIYNTYEGFKSSYEKNSKIINKKHKSKSQIVKDIISTIKI